MLSKPIDKVKTDFKNNYYNIVLLPILRKVNYTLSYVKNDNTAEVLRDYILAGFLGTRLDRFFKEVSIKGKINQDINVQIHQLSILKIILQRNNNRRIETEFDGLFAVVDTNVDTCLDVFVKVNKASMKNKTFLNNVRLDTIIENFYKKTSLNFDLVIKNNRIYFRIFSGNKFREPLFGKLINERKLSDYYDTLKFIEEITTEIVKS